MMGKWMGKDGDFMGFFSCPFYYPVIPSKRKIRGKTLIFLIYSLNFVFDLTKIKWGSIGIWWDDYGGDNGVCSSHEVENSRGMNGDSKAIMRIKKEPYVARKMCATQGSIFSFFLGISQDAKLCLFQGVRRCPDFPETFVSYCTQK